MLTEQSPLANRISINKASTQRPASNVTSTLITTPTFEQSIALLDACCRSYSHVAIAAYQDGLFRRELGSWSRINNSCIIADHVVYSICAHRSCALQVEFLLQAKASPKSLNLKAMRAQNLSRECCPQHQSNTNCQRPVSADADPLEFLILI